MLMIFLDSEMTGLNPEKHRLLEIAYIVIDSTTGSRILSYESIVKQTEEVWANADLESLKVCGFSWEKVLKGKSESLVASEITRDWTQMGLSDKTGVFVCQNPSQDRMFFNQLISSDLHQKYGWPYHWLDLASMYFAVLQLEDKKTVRDLKESGLSKNKIASHYGIPPEKKPHGALAGVEHLLACYEAMFGKIGSSV